jgi:DNA-binding transcriptional ArsR family regulator
MSRLLPLRGSVDTGDREPRLIDLDEDVADEVFDALSSRTTRKIFSELHESPQAASDLAEVTDTSVQNVQYHLEKLVAADLVEVVDTWYSERGTEMKVYAPTDEALVLFAGEDTEGTLRTLLGRLVGGLGLLIPASAVVAWVAGRFDSATTGYSGADTSGRVAGGADAGGEAGGDTVTPTGTDTPGGGDADAGVAVADGGEDVAEATEATTPTGTDTPVPEPEAATPNGSVDLARESTPALEPSATAQPRPETVDMTATPAPEFDAAEATVTPAPQEAVDVATDTAGGTDPAVLAGVAFFAGGTFVLALVAVAWYWSVR